MDLFLRNSVERRSFLFYFKRHLNWDINNIFQDVTKDWKEFAPIRRFK